MSDDLLPITRNDMIAEIRREIAMRQRAYPRWVAAGKMSANKSRRQIAVMQAIERAIASGVVPE